MKKNISINISGIIFHIEEDGYDKLKNYLDSVNKYFSSFDDSSEIIADIESRIAEIFLAKLSDEKQVITHDDVEELVATMGSIRDFQAIEEPLLEEEEAEEKESEEGAEGEEKKATKRLYRDNQRKLIGGVCAGIAHYFSIDPLWIRIIFVVFAAGTILNISGGAFILAYIILWIVIPESDELVEDKKIKKLYRNPDDQVLGGVSSGIAAYFGIDVVIVRILFVLFLFFSFGFGLILYIVLWIILPEAKTVTEKVQMKGDPVTLSNIESNIKSRLKVKEDGEESTWTKIFLFPFRLIAQIVNGLANALGPIFMFLLEAIRVLVGIFIVLLGVTLLFSIIVAMGTVLGVITSTPYWLEVEPFRLEVFTGMFPVWGYVAAFFATAIPSLALVFLGIRIIAKSSVVGTTVGWSLFALWILSIIALSFAVPVVVADFRDRAQVRETVTYEIEAASARLELNETGYDDWDIDFDGYDPVSLRLAGHAGENFELIKTVEARGRNEAAAREYAEMVSYTVSQRNDSVIVFDSEYRFTPDNPVFRRQEISMTLKIPYDFPFTVSYDLRKILSRSSVRRLGYSIYELDDHTWMFTADGLECITCEEEEAEEDSDADPEPAGEEPDVTSSGASESFDFEGFNEIEIDDAMEVRITQGAGYNIILKGDEDDLREVKLYQYGNRLEIDQEARWSRGDARVEVEITLPYLRSVSLGSASDTEIRGFKQDDLEINMSGGAEANVYVDVDDLDLDLSGATELNLHGDGESITVELSGTSELDAMDYEVDEVDVVARRASRAEFYVNELIQSERSSGSRVSYKGDARLRGRARRIRD